MLPRPLDDLASVIRVVLRFERSDAIEVVGGEREAQKHRCLDESQDPKEAAVEISKGALRAEFADSTTCRRPMLIRQAVVPNVIDCHHGNSTGIAVWIPLQQCSASISTSGAAPKCLMVFGKERLRSSPEQNGHFHR